MTDQEKMKNARTQDWYDTIWKTVGKCVFCDLKDKYILFEENGVALTINLYPYIDGQMMAIPRRHVNSPKDLTQLEWETMRKFSYIAKKIIRKIHGHKGMWSLVREGGEVANMTVTDHLHMQLIPFDAPDLCKWNYRELKYTPLENVDLYKKAFKEIVISYKKFDIKYTQRTSLPIVCDVIIENSKGEILFEKRKSKHKVKDDLLTLPGGHVDDISLPLTQSLAKEVEEETGLKLDDLGFKIQDSRISDLKFLKVSKHLKLKFMRDEKFIRNTYYYKLDKRSNLKVGGEIKELVWIKKGKLVGRISDETKMLIQNTFGTFTLG